MDMVQFLISIVVSPLIASATPPVSLVEKVIAQGVSRPAAEAAFAKLEEFKDHVTKNRFMAIIDFTKHSGRKRFYLVDRIAGSVEAMTVAHGTASDPDKNGYAQYFSNIPNSKMSSLGAYIVSERYIGKHGASLRLDGLEGTNDQARSRAIVLHSADYVRDGRSKQGWSWGCPALPKKHMDGVVEALRDGAFMYAYGVNTYRENAVDMYEMMNSRLPGYKWVDEAEDAPIDGEP